MRPHDYLPLVAHHVYDFCVGLLGDTIVAEWVVGNFFIVFFASLGCCVAVYGLQKVWAWITESGQGFCGHIQSLVLGVLQLAGCALAAAVLFTWSWKVFEFVYSRAEMQEYTHTAEARGWELFKSWTSILRDVLG